MDLAHVRIRITAPTPRWIASMPGTRTSTYSMNDGCETSRSSTIIYTYSVYYYKPFRIKLTSPSAEEAFMRIYDPDVAAGADTVDFSMWNFKPVSYEMPHPFFDISCISWSILMLASQSFTNVNTDVLLLRWCDPLQHMLLLFNLHIFAFLHALTERVRQLDRVYRLQSEPLFSVWKAILTIHDSFFSFDEDSWQFLNVTCCTAV